jgi:hypothetical protein
LDDQQEESLLARLAPSVVRLLGLFLGCGYVLAGAMVLYCHANPSTTEPGDICYQLGERLERTHSETLQTLVTLLAGAGLGRQP